MESGISKMPIASVKDGDKTGQIIHVKYAMSLDQVRINLTESLRLTCLKCGNFNYKDAVYCIMCGSKLPEVQ
jgi:hypothetical protein